MVTNGLSPATNAAAEATFGVPVLALVWMICRCRFERLTVSSSTTPMVPTPAAAR